MNAPGIFQFFAQACIVVLGWIVVHRLSVLRDGRNARMEVVVRLIDGAWELSERLLLAALDYHGNVRHLGHEREIKTTFQDLMLRTISFADLCPNVKQIAVCRNAVFSLRVCVTGTHFEDAHTMPVDETSTLFWEMADHTMRVKRAFLKLRHLQFSNR